MSWELQRLDWLEVLCRFLGLCLSWPSTPTKWVPFPVKSHFCSPAIPCVHNHAPRESALYRMAIKLWQGLWRSYKVYLYHVNRIRVKRSLFSKRLRGWDCLNFCHYVLKLSWKGWLKGLGAGRFSGEERGGLGGRGGGGGVSNSVLASYPLSNVLQWRFETGNITWKETAQSTDDHHSSRKPMFTILLLGLWKHTGVNCFDRNKGILEFFTYEYSMWLVSASNPSLSFQSSQSHCWHNECVHKAPFLKKKGV